MQGCPFGVAGSDGVFQGTVAVCHPGVRESTLDLGRVQLARPLLAPVVLSTASCNIFPALFLPNPLSVSLFQPVDMHDGHFTAQIPNTVIQLKQTGHYLKRPYPGFPKLGALSRFLP